MSLENKTYHRLKAARVAAWEEPKSLLLDGTTEDGRSIYLRVDIYRENLVRLRVSPKPIGDKQTVMQAGELFCNCAVEKENDENRIVIKTAQLHLCIQKDPWQLTITDPEGKPICSEAKDVDPHGRYLHPPLGFYEMSDRTVVAMSMTMHPDEAFYGFGEKNGPLNKRNHVMRCWNESAGPWGEGLHKNVPFFMSSRGHGVYINSSCPQLFEMGVRSHDSYAFAVADEVMDLFFIYGPSFKQIIETYTEITGRPSVPPAWSFGIWMSRNAYRSRAEMEVVGTRMREERLPCDVLKLDVGWFSHPGRGSEVDFDMEWNTETFPDPEAFLAGLKEQGFKVCLFIQVWVLKECAMAQEARSLGYILKNTDGVEHSWDMGSNCPVVAFDLTIPECREWYKEKLKGFLAQGIATFFCDWAISSPTTNVYAAMDSVEYNNVHGLHFIRTAYEAIEEFTGRPGVVWGITGCAGIQRYPASYCGDSRSTFSEMASVLRGGLSCAMSGIGLWGTDIGGFYGPRVEKSLYIRYFQLGMLLPFAQFHGVGAREPWNYDEETVEIYRKYADLRYRLIPYLVSQTYLSQQTGIPLMRPLVLDFQDDPNTANLEGQYLLGESLLVAPVFGEASEQRVYLPAGDWVNFWTNRTESGPKWIMSPTPLDTMPLFVRTGAIIPTSPSIQFVGQEKPESLSLLIYPKQGRVETTIYEETRTTTVQCSLDGSRLSLVIRSHAGQTGPCTIVLQNLDEPLAITCNGTKLHRHDSEQVFNEGNWMLGERCVFLHLPASASPLSVQFDINDSAAS
ncbi:MAG TPA: TIM-barrel domain-containing protein [Abditibacteriaceae bacterium]